MFQSTGLDIKSLEEDDGAALVQSMSTMDISFQDKEAFMALSRRFRGMPLLYHRWPPLLNGGR
jgi:hypothetical protein